MTNRKPLAYSRPETDEELLARIRERAGTKHVQCGSEPIDETADRHRLQRRIVWVDA